MGAIVNFLKIKNNISFVLSLRKKFILFYKKYFTLSKRCVTIGSGGGNVKVAGKVKQRQLAIFAKEQFVRTLKKAYNSESVYLDISEFGTVYVYVDAPDVPKSQEGLRNVLTNFLGVGKVTEITGTCNEVWVAYKEYKV